jgi:putative transposase
MPNGYLYLCAIIDWHSRYVLTWCLSNTHDSEFCQHLLKQAIDKHGKPKKFNTDQGSEFTASGFTSILNENGIQISMDGKGRALILSIIFRSGSRSTTMRGPTSRCNPSPPTNSVYLE